MRLNSPNTLTMSQRWVGRGLKSAWTGAISYTCNFGRSHTARKIVSSYGPAHYSVSTDSDGATVYYGTTAIRPKNANCSIGVLVDQVSNNFNNGTTYLIFDGFTYGVLIFSLAAASTKLRYEITNNGSAYENVESDVGVFDPTTDSKWHWLEIKRLGKDVWFFVDGVQMGAMKTLTNGYVPGWSASKSFTVNGCCGPLAGTYASANTSCAYAYYFDEFIPDTTLIRANPSTLFEPVRKRMIYAPAAAAASFQPAWARNSTRIIGVGVGNA